MKSNNMWANICKRYGCDACKGELECGRKSGAYSIYRSPTTNGLTSPGFRYINSGMLKKIVFMLIVAFTLQLGWTVASAYCMHETDKASQHFGHHPHQHQAGDTAAVDTAAVDTADDDKKTNPKKTALHSDCSFCTLNLVAVSIWNGELVNPLLMGLQHGSSPSDPSAPYLGRPLRPKWMIAA